MVGHHHPHICCYTFKSYNIILFLNCCNSVRSHGIGRFFFCIVYNRKKICEGSKNTEINWDITNMYTWVLSCVERCFLIRLSILRTWYCVCVDFFLFRFRIFEFIEFIVQMVTKNYWIGIHWRRRKGRWVICSISMGLCMHWAILCAYACVLCVRYAQ